MASWWWSAYRWQFFNPDTTFVNRLFDVGRKMIRRDRNHPSVVLWETALNESRYPVSLAEDLQKMAHAEMPGDQMYTAGDYLGHAIWNTAMMSSTNR